ncbi:hypothetical protein WJX81_002589 [Elliptochloris bilobata]|uniref:Uncharacterized protein n=1 Tax=Elliptochloris bilobata TaxID=381761 RepID=A0AAW1RVY5_9CHLO
MGALSADVGASLAFVKASQSCVITAPLEEAWAAVREWAPFAWLPHVDGRSVQSMLVSGGANTAVGATRMVKIGEQQVFEKLVALDDEEHVLKWRLISHEATINPFVASFVNYLCTLHLHKVTVTNQTFFSWQGEFYTEPEHADAMKATFERWYTTAFQSLQNYVVARRSVMLPQTLYTVQPGVPSQVGLQLPAGAQPQMWVSVPQQAQAHAQQAAPPRWASGGQTAASAQAQGLRRDQSGSSLHSLPNSIASQGVGTPHGQGAYLSSGGGGALSPQHQAALQRGSFHSGGSSASEEELQAAVRHLAMHHNVAVQQQQQAQVQAQAQLQAAQAQAAQLQAAQMQAAQQLQAQQQAQAQQLAAQQAAQAQQAQRAHIAHHQQLQANAAQAQAAHVEALAQAQGASAQA